MIDGSLGSTGGIQLSGGSLAGRVIGGGEDSCIGLSCRQYSTSDGSSSSEIRAASIRKRRKSCQFRST